MAAVDASRKAEADKDQSDEQTSAPEKRYIFSFDDFLRREYRFGIDPSRPLCKAFLQGHCPLGNDCPDRHQTPTSHNNLVCKHWLRGLCKKGNACEFLHEYNLRKMPECSYFSRHGNCTNGDDCLYLHISQSSRKPLCPLYRQGFCPLGPSCPKQHVRQQPPCPLYLAGFCPDGRDCTRGSHMRYNPNLKTIDDKPPEGKDQDFAGRYSTRDKYGR